MNIELDGRPVLRVERIPQAHDDTINDTINDNVLLTERDDQILLSEIKNLLRFMIADHYTELGGGPIRGLVPGPVNDDDSPIEVVEHLWWSSGDFAWPASRDVEGVRQYLIESNDARIETQAHWPPHRMSPLMYQDTPYHIIESVWRDWCCEARNKPRQVRLTHSYCYM